MKARRIIVNADDLGLAPSVNTAIFDVFRAGNLNSATLLVEMPGTDDAVRRLADHTGLAVGLHFNITEGRALSGTSSLTDASGTFLPRGVLFRAAVRGRIDPRHVRTEFEAQLQRMQDLGLRPDHADSHQHVMMFPAIFRAIRPVVEERALPVRLVRPPWSTVTRDLARPKRAAKQLLNLRFAHRNMQGLQVASNDRLVSIHDLADPGPYGPATYDRLLKGTRKDEVVELMVHPYLLGEDVLDQYKLDRAQKMPFLQRCVAEYEALRGERLFDACRMITFAELEKP
jgi:chitin disaccharide deacetylase